MKIIPGVNVPSVSDENSNPTADAMMISSLLNDLIDKALKVEPSTNSVVKVRKAAEDLIKAFQTLQDTA